MFEEFKLIAPKNQEFEYQQNNHNSWTSRPNMKILLLVQKSRNFILKTILQKETLSSNIEAFENERAFMDTTVKKSGKNFSGREKRAPMHL